MYPADGPLLISVEKRRSTSQWGERQVSSCRATMGGMQRICNSLPNTPPNPCAAPGWGDMSVLLFTLYIVLASAIRGFPPSTPSWHAWGSNGSVVQGRVNALGLPPTVCRHSRLEPRRRPSRPNPCPEPELSTRAGAGRVRCSSLSTKNEISALAVVARFPKSWRAARDWNEPVRPHTQQASRSPAWKCSAGSDMAVIAPSRAVLPIWTRRQKSVWRCSCQAAICFDPVRAVVQFYVPDFRCGSIHLSASEPT